MNRSTFVLLLGLALAACGGSPASSTTTTEDDATTTTTTTTTSGSESQAALVPIGETQIGDRSTCPVSGEEFVVSESSPTAQHDGKTYHFCCAGCAERFEADPHGFLEHHEG